MTSKAEKRFILQNRLSVFCLMEYEGGVAAVENPAIIIIMNFPMEESDQLEVEGSSHTVNIGDTLQLTPVTNGTMEEVYSWKSSDPKSRASTGRDRYSAGAKERQ